MDFLSQNEDTMASREEKFIFKTGRLGRFLDIGSQVWPLCVMCLIIGTRLA